MGLMQKMRKNTWHPMGLGTAQCSKHATRMQHAWPTYAQGLDHAQRTQLAPYTAEHMPLNAPRHTTRRTHMEQSRAEQKWMDEQIDKHMNLLTCRFSSFVPALLFHNEFPYRVRGSIMFWKNIKNVKIDV